MSATYRVLESVWHVVPEAVRDLVRKSQLNRVKELARRISLGRHQYLYGEAYYHQIEQIASSSAAVMAASIADAFRPRSLVDVGCGTGALLDALKARGVPGVGLEYSDEGIHRCQARGVAARKFDITRDPLPPDLVGRELVTSFEVAEHLSEKFADRFVNLLCLASRTVVVSAATPGQGGHDHLNEQPQEYWIGKFVRRGYQFDHDLSNRWRATWERQGVAHYYSRNVMVFRAD